MNDNHITPKWLIEELNKEFGIFDLDPCGNINSLLYTAKNVFLYPYMDGLKEKWYGSVYVNPPYSQGNIPIWINKAMNELDNCKLIVMLLPSDTSTKWFHKWFLIEYEGFNPSFHYYMFNQHIKAELRFLNRINFSNSANNAKFPSMLVILRP